MTTTSRMPALLAAVAGCLLLVVAALYFVEPAHSLPSFFPGHVSPGDAEANHHHHVKHGIAALAVALAAFAYAWFHSGPSARHEVA
jgi:divalent metal cation (Fe/Co/Zn/Cd) transporter